MINVIKEHLERVLFREKYSEKLYPFICGTNHSYTRSQKPSQPFAESKENTRRQALVASRDRARESRRASRVATCDSSSLQPCASMCAMPPALREHAVRCLQPTAAYCHANAHANMLQHAWLNPPSTICGSIYFKAHCLLYRKQSTCITNVT